MTESAKRKARKKRTKLGVTAEADASEVLQACASSSDVLQKFDDVVQNSLSKVRIRLDMSSCDEGEN